MIDRKAGTGTVSAAADSYKCVFNGGPEFREFHILFAQFLTNFFEFTTTDGNGLLCSFHSGVVVVVVRVNETAAERYKIGYSTSLPR